ncbi:hypothetical protein F5Y04DRAFT_291225 [Hypomontagnella monticulosa]|nr:hypothetical protein F5Y04DRAFT_291225 [Hypomontagnella monticulosa]
MADPTLINEELLQPSFIHSSPFQPSEANLPDGLQATGGHSQLETPNILTSIQIRNISRTIHRLIAKRKKLNRDLLLEAGKTNPGPADWWRLGTLLQWEKQLDTKEQTCSAEISRLENSLAVDLSPESVRRYNRVQQLHYRYKTRLGLIPQPLQTIDITSVSPLRPPSQWNHTGEDNSAEMTSDKKHSKLRSNSQADDASQSDGATRATAAGRPLKGGKKASKRKYRSSKKHKQDTSNESDASTNPGVEKKNKKQKEMSSDTDSPRKDKEPGRKKSSKKHKSRKEKTKLKKHRQPKVGTNNPLDGDPVSDLASFKPRRHGERQESNLEVTTASRAPPSSAAIGTREGGTERFEHQSRRLSAIAKGYLDDSNVIFDRPAPTSYVPPNDWMMSGALVTHPSQVQGITPRPDPDLPNTGSIEKDSDNDFGGDGAGDENTRDKDGHGCEVSSTGRKHKSRTFSEGAIGGKSRSAWFSAFPNDDGHSYDDSACEVERLLSSDPSVAASSPILHTKQGQRLKSTKSPRPIRITGPQLPKVYDRVMPPVPLTSLPAVLDSNGPTNKPGKKEVKRDKHSSLVRRNLFGTKPYHSLGQAQSEGRARAGNPSITFPDIKYPAPAANSAGDLVGFVGIPGAETVNRIIRNSPLAANKRRQSLPEMLTSDRAILQEEKEVWTKMMGF